MTVLVVDDQVNVVNGIVSGVDWESAGISKVLYAYNASMARDILECQPVDILLSDIEMPVEDGLSLFRWVRGRGLPVECIFLTSHADFIYATEALKLGSFDYLLQPARYEEIRGVVQKAVEKIQENRQTQQMYSYGKAVYRNRDLFLQGILKDWLTGVSLQFREILKCFGDLGIPMREESQTRIAMVHLLRWYNEPWEATSLYAALENIATELFEQLGQGLLLLRLEKTSYLLFLFPKALQNLPEDAVLEAQLLRLAEIFQMHLHCDIACYTGAAVPLKESPTLAQRLKKMQLDNVSRQSGVFFYEQPKLLPPALIRTEKLPYWKNLLLNGCPKMAEEEIFTYLRQAEESGVLNHEFLEQFCGDFIRMLAKLPQENHFRDILIQPEIQDSFSHASESLEGALAFVQRVLQQFQPFEGKGSQKDQMNRIVEYIQHHLGEELRRSDIAEAVYLNPDYLSRLFRKEKGISLKEYILCEKMKTARAILRSTNLPVAVVAARVGFENYSYFSQVYKKVVGVNPSAERLKNPNAYPKEVG